MRIRTTAMAIMTMSSNMLGIDLLARKRAMLMDVFGRVRDR
jgi:hypothetical protein